MDMSSDTDRHSNDPHEEDVAVDNIISQEFHKLDCNDDNADVGATHHENEHHDDDNDDDDFTFVFIGDDDSNSSPAAIYAFQDGQNFPLFDQKLLLDGTEYELEQVHDQNLPFKPPVNRVFTELPPPRGGGFIESSSKKLENGHQEEEEAAGPFCSWSKDQSTSGSGTTSSHDQGLTKKSNSTGFSKLWRLREKVHRSNSDGRDAFVFLKGNSTDHKTTSSSSSSSSSSSAKAPVSRGDHGSHGSFVKVVNGNGSTRKAKVVKKTTISAHEAYMRSRGGHMEEERRKSYLPYRPELMGFFTNVHGGLSKNVHPY